MDVISAIGPASTLLPGDEIDGYRPINRNGEVTQNAFIDGELWNEIAHGSKESTPVKYEPMTESKTQFHEWASVIPGQVCVTKKDRHTRYRSHITAETAVPVLACAAMLDDTDNNEYQFAGICRSKSIREYDEVANGPTKDEYFTLAIGGPFTCLNNSNGPIQVGDAVEWTFWDDENSWNPSWKGLPANKRQKAGPRKIIIRKATSTYGRVFGRALSYARRGEPIDILIGTPSM